MSEREWAMVMDYMRGNTKPLLDYIYEELGSTDLKYCADRALALVGKDAKYISTPEPWAIGHSKALWFWDNGRNYVIALSELPAKGFFKAKKVTPKPSKLTAIWC